MNNISKKTLKNVIKQFLLENPTILYEAKPKEKPKAGYQWAFNRGMPEKYGDSKWIQVKKPKSGLKLRWAAGELWALPDIEDSGYDWKWTDKGWKKERWLPKGAQVVSKGKSAKDYDEKPAMWQYFFDPDHEAHGLVSTKQAVNRAAVDLGHGPNIFSGEDWYHAFSSEGAPGTGASWQTSGYEIDPKTGKPTGELAKVPAEIAYNVFRAHAEGRGGVDGPGLMTKEEFEAEGEEFFNNYVSAPAAGALAILAVAAAAGIGVAAGGATYTTGIGGGTAASGKLAAGTALRGLGSAMNFWGPGLINQGLLRIGIPAARSKWIAGAIYGIIEGVGITESMWCDLNVDGFRLYDDAFKYIDPIHLVVAGVQRVLPGGETGNVLGGATQFGGDIDWGDTEQVSGFLDNWQNSLKNSEDRQTVQKLRGDMETKVAEIKRMVAAGEMCPDVLDKVKELKLDIKAASAKLERSAREMKAQAEVDKGRRAKKTKAFVAKMKKDTTAAAGKKKEKKPDELEAELEKGLENPDIDEEEKKEIEGIFNKYMGDDDLSNEEEEELEKLFQSFLKDED